MSKYELIVNSMPDAVITVDRACRIIEANPAAAELFARKPLLGLSLLAVSGSTELASLAEKGFAAPAASESEIAVYPPSGGQRWFRVFVSALSPTEALVTLNDITKLKRLERVRKDFVANVSHELRTPIQLIKGFAETLQEDCLSSEDRAHYLDIIGRNADRMENLIEDLLSLARLEQEGQNRPELDDITIISAVSEAVECIAPKAKRRGICIQTDIPENLKACLNRGLTVEALCNLLDNAVKYSPDISSVLVHSWQEGDTVSISVQDHGIGIPSRDLPRLFERFYRVDKARSKAEGGTGLGLAIVKHIAIAQGGSVEAESWEGEGSRFTLHFPSHAHAGKQ